MCINLIQNQGLTTFVYCSYRETMLLYKSIVSNWILLASEEIHRKMQLSYKKKVRQEYTTREGDEWMENIIYVH